MRLCRTLASWFHLLLLLPVAQGAEERPLPPASPPVLRLEPGGPMSQVTALAFSPDGRTLYAGGYDKVVRVWTIANGQFELKKIYRVPVGPGVDGVVNALAVSPDGRWLAVGGSGVIRGSAGFRAGGVIDPRAGRLSDAMLRDQGLIHLFDTTGKGIKLLRGHRGSVRALTFVTGAEGRPLLISLARERGTEDETGVLRLWAVDRAESVAESKPLPSPGDGRPALAAWLPGKNARNPVVAVACERQPLRLWEPGTNRFQTVGKQEFFNDTSVFLPDEARPGRGTLLTATAAGPAGRIDVRTVDGDEPGPARKAILPERHVGRALAVIPARGERPALAALVVRRLERSPQSDEYRLRLLSLGERFTTRADFPLWRGGYFPAIAASSDGRYLAVAGDRAQAIQVFKVADLIAERPETRPEISLRGKGVSVRQARLARRGKERGLLLEVERAGGKETDSLLFSLPGRRLLAPDGWQPDVADNQGWQVTLSRGKDGHVYVVKHPTEKGGEIRLEPGQEPTRYALLPPCPPFNRPFLAVGYQWDGGTYLSLYDVRAGYRVRRYTGHVNPIRSLAFDAAGRLLVSTGADQTTRVWSLTDLGKNLGKQGMLLGLAFDKEDAGLRILRLEAADLSEPNRKALSQKKVKEGDTIEGLLIEGKLQRFASAADFYRALRGIAPGQTVTLQVRDRGPVRLKTDQAVDERKPLFSFFLTEGKRPEDRRWVGWNPEGPYETGNLARTESYIGWHRNTGEPGSPVSFSPAGDYHKEYYREGILRHLIDKGNLLEARRAWRDEPPPPPELDVRVTGRTPTLPRDPDGNLLVRQGPLTLRVAVDGTPLDKLRSVRWKFDNGPWQDFGQDDRDRQADLTTQRWTPRKVHRIQVAAETLEARPVLATQEVALRYLPPAPTVQPDANWLKKYPGLASGWYETDEETFPVRALVTAGTGGLGEMPKVQVQVIHNGQAQKSDGLKVDRQLALRPGVNTVEVEAVNEGVLATTREQESARYSFRVRYRPKAPPEVTIEAVVPEGGEALPVISGKPLLVHTGQVRIQGRVTAGDPLTEVLRRHTPKGKPAREMTPSGFKAESKPMMFVLDDRITLVPGEQELVFEARTARTRARPVRLTLTYRPELPNLEPVGGWKQLSRPGEAEDFTLVWRLTGPEHPGAYKATASLNGQEVRAGLDRDRRRLTLTGRLRSRQNEWRVVLTDDLGSRREATVAVYRQSPPRKVRLEGPAKVEKTRIDLTAFCETDTTLPPLEAALTRAGMPERQIPASDFVKAGTNGDRTSWKATVRGVSLEKGENRFQLSVRNTDGESLTPGETTVTAVAPPPPKAIVEAPDLNQTVGARRFSFRVGVKSPSPARVTVWHEGKQRGNVTHKQEGRETVYRVEVELQPGLNHLRVVVSNAGGDVVHEGNVSYPPRGALLRLVKLENRDSPGEFLEPERYEWGAPVFKRPAATGNVWLHGYLEWQGDRSPDVEEGLAVRAWVNDFEQFEVPLRTVVRETVTVREGGTTRRKEVWRRAFRSPLRLNRAENRVQLAFPCLQLEEDAARGFEVGCARPARDQRLHLLVVTPGLREPTALTDRLLKALQARDIKGTRFTTPAFREGRLYGPLPWDIQRREIESTLRYIKDTIGRTRGPFNEVVLVYFQGSEGIEGGRPYLLTEESRQRGRLKETALDGNRVREILSDVTGAKLLLLDVRPEGKDVVARDRPVPHVGYLRYLWLGDRNPREEQRLVYALEVCLGRASLLREVSGLLRGWSNSLGRVANLDQKYPTGLQELQLGRQER
jgi:WD40 repeat protein